MADNIWRGDAPAVAQVNTFAFAGTWETDDVVRVTIGGKTYDFTTGSATIATFLATLVTNWTALDSDEYPEFAEITPTRSGDNLLLTATTAGVPFTATLTPLEANLGAADAQTIEGAGTATTGTATTASSGPNHWDTAANWSAGAVPADTEDVWLQDSAIDILYGLDQSAIEPTSLNILASYTGKIGLPAKVNAGDDDEYYEYRSRYLTIGPLILNIGQGTGTGSPRLNINTGTDPCTVNIHSTGQAEQNRTHAVQYKGVEAGNVINIYQGTLAVAPEGGEVATVPIIRQSYRTSVDSDTTVLLGKGCTLTTIDKLGGTLEINSAATTITQNGGTLMTYGTGAITTLTLRGGTAYPNSTGTITTLTVSNDAHADFSQSLVARTVTNCEKYEATSRISDPFKVVTFTNGIDCHEHGGEGVTFGEHVRLTRGSVA